MLSGDHRSFVVSDHVAVRRFSSETVLLNLETGHYHGLDAFGSHFFSALERHADIELACQTLASQLDVELPRVRSDMLAFCLQLEERGLIESYRDAR